eukprot:scaffold3499_cov117-Isochrysis_galbana.AAC.1
MRSGDVEEEGLARLIGPRRDLGPPCRARAIGLCRNDEQQHAQDGIFVAIRRRAGTPFCGDGIVKLP